MTMDDIDPYPSKLPSFFFERGCTPRSVAMENQSGKVAVQIYIIELDTGIGFFIRFEIDIL